MRDTKGKLSRFCTPSFLSVKGAERHDGVHSCFRAKKCLAIRLSICQTEDGAVTSPFFCSSFVGGLSVDVTLVTHSWKGLTIFTVGLHIRRRVRQFIWNWNHDGVDFVFRAKKCPAIGGKCCS